MGRNGTGIIIGLIFILLGFGFFIDQLGLNLGFSIASFWPIIVILLGLFIFTRRNIFGGFIVTGVGVAFLINEFTNIDAFSLFWPLIIIAVGVSILFKPSTKQWSSSSLSSSDSINDSAVFWGVDKVITSQSFKGGKVDAVFGGFKLDLRGAKLAEGGATLEVNAVFGGGEILVPETFRVEASGDGVFGGWENKAKTSEDQNAPLLRIKGSAVFGGIEVRN